MEFVVNYSEKQPLLGGTSEPNKNTRVQHNGNAAVYSRRKSSTAKLAVERLVRTRERLWATAISASVAAIPTLLVGYTLGYPSSAIPQLQALPPGRQFGDLLTALFAVSGIAIIAMNALVTINWRQTKNHKSTKNPYSKLYAGLVPRPNPLTRKGSGLVCLQPDITYKNLLVTFLGFCMSAGFECAADHIWKFSPRHGFNYHQFAFAPVGALFGAPIAGVIADRWGRKLALLLAGVPYLVGYLMMTLAYLIGDIAAFKAVLLTGRLLTGVGMGWSCLAVPVYHGEISSAKLRGIFGSFAQLSLSLGVVLVYGIGSIESFQYYYVALIAAGATAVFELMMVWFKETPRWLLSNGCEDETIAVLRFLRGPEISFEKELNDMKGNLSGNTNLSWLQVLKEFKRRSVLIPFLIMAFIMFFQQVGGLNVISTYIEIIFKDANVPHPELAPIYAVGVAGLVTAFVATIVMDIFGRKFLLIVSGIGTLLGTTLLGTHFFITRPSLCQNSTNLTATLLQNSPSLQDSTDVSCNPQYAPLAIVGIIVYTVLFTIGWGPVPWVLLGELLPLQVRGVASGIVTFINWGTAAMVTGFYPNYAKSVQLWFAWWSFSVLNLASVLFVVLFVFETKGKSLEEIQQKFEGKRRTNS